MPQPLESLAVWPVVSGLIFMHRSLGIAYNEVVVALLDEPQSTPSLRRFTTYLSVMTTLLLLIITGTPLSAIWFERVSALNPSLAALAHLSLWIALPIPGLNVLQSWYQGAIVHNRRTRAISEAVGIFLLTSSALLWAGVAWGQVTGLYIGMVAFGVGSLAQTAWLWYRGRPVMRSLRARDADSLPLQVMSSPISSK
jgi:O-antigen/teichoic acid export membrane protein